MYTDEILKLKNYRTYYVDVILDRLNQILLKRLILEGLLLTNLELLILKLLTDFFLSFHVLDYLLILIFDFIFYLSLIFDIIFFKIVNYIL